MPVRGTLPKFPKRPLSPPRDSLREVPESYRNHSPVTCIPIPGRQEASIRTRATRPPEIARRRPAGRRYCKRYDPRRPRQPSREDSRLNAPAAIARAGRAGRRGEWGGGGQRGGDRAGGGRWCEPELARQARPRRPGGRPRGRNLPTGADRPGGAEMLRPLATRVRSQAGGARPTQRARPRSRGRRRRAGRRCCARLRTEPAAELAEAGRRKALG